MKKDMFKKVAAVVCAVLIALVAYGCVEEKAEGTIVIGKTIVTEEELDTVMGHYTFAGESHDITIREVIEEFTTVEAAVDANGTYAVPSTDDVLSYVRNHIILDEAAEREITVTDDDVAAYCTDTYGTTDYDSIAASVGVTTEVAMDQLRDAATMSQLRGQVVTTNPGAAPEAPEASTDEDEATSEYADYVLALVGDEWDSENDTWASSEGPYYAALSTYPISNDSATYEAAYAAYSVAYQDWYNVYTQMTSEWTDFANSLFCQASISIGTAAV